MIIRASHWWAALSVATVTHIFGLLWLSQPTARVDPPMVSTGIVIALEDKLAQQREHAVSVPQPSDSVSDIRSELTQPRDAFEAATMRPAKPAPSASLPEPAKEFTSEASDIVSAPTLALEEPPETTFTKPEIQAAASLPNPQAVGAATEQSQIVYEAERAVKDVSTAGPPSAVTSLQLEAIHPNVITGNDVTAVASEPLPQTKFDELTPAISQQIKSIFDQRAVETEPLTPSEDVIARTAPTPISPVQQRLVRGVTAQYAGVLKGWLQRNMRYPRDAWLEGQQGTVVVLFTIGRDGNVITSRLERSSGHNLLDGEAMQMVKRADPFPAMPLEIVGNELELRVPIVFYIKDYERQREIPPIYLK